MTEYELVRQIKNQCPNNQMRDVFFAEVTCEDPAEYVRTMLKDGALEMTVNYGPGGAVTVDAVVDGLVKEFVFTPI